MVASRLQSNIISAGFRKHCPAFGPFKKHTSPAKAFRSLQPTKPAPGRCDDPKQDPRPKMTQQMSLIAVDALNIASRGAREIKGTH